MENLEEKRKEYEEIINKIEKIQKKATTDAYKEQGYESGSTVEIPSELFTEITNFISLQAHVNRTSMQGLEALEMTQAPLSLKLMEIHLKNVDEGKTVPFEKLDREDAKAKIKEVKR